ncbi:MAG TPA: PAS domain S-box protein [Polyangiaceae bacterium]|nr:PAS domain S-box protein [Polyangiaceae bacterium]
MSIEPNPANAGAEISAALSRQLLDSAPDAMVVMNGGGRIELVNLQTERLFGYPRAELLGQPIELLIPERFRAAHVDHRSGFVRAPKLRPMGSGLELFGRRKDGSEFPIEISLSPVNTAAGILVSSAIRDVSERQRAERKFRSLLEAAPDAIVIVDRQGCIALVNAQTEKVFGYPRAELVGQSVDMLVPKRLRGTHRIHREGYSHAPKTRSMGAGLELFGLRKDGSEFPVEISLSPLETEDGTWVSTAVRDISARRLAEASARLASDRLLSAVESIQGMLALYDAQDRLVLCNSACRELVGRGASGAIVGRTFLELLQDAVSSNLFDVGERTPDEFVAAWLSYHQNPFGVLDVKTQAGQSFRVAERRTLEGGVVSTMWDTTADAQREADLVQARAAAESANSAKSEFLSSMSHELRTPLNAILGFAQLLQRDRKSPLNERQLEKLDYVLKGGEHLLRLIDDILDLSRVEAGQVSVSAEPVGVAEVLSEVRSTLAPMAARFGVELRLEPLPDAGRQVIADRTRFVQILINFGSNSIKYNRPGGVVRLVVSNAGAALRISMIDDGIGIPLDKQDKIFQPFQRAGQEAGPIEGTGIGLAITRRLAELMSGSVGFVSEPGKGSEFWLDLPVFEESRVRMPASMPKLASETLSTLTEPSYKVVYIEDNPSNIAFMRDLLEEFERINLIAIPTAEVGIEVVREQRPDLVIMDINLPGMSGFEATRRLRDWPETADIPVIALTAAAMVGDRKRASEAGFRKYLTKPVKIDELLQLLKELLPTRRSASMDVESELGE